MRRNLLLTGYTGYTDVEKVRNFVESFDAVRNEDDDLAVVYETRSEINDWLDEKDWVIQLKRERASSCNYTNRFKWFHEVIDSSSVHDLFLTADVRDVVFQFNPFDWMKENMKKDFIICSEDVKFSSPRGGKWNLDTVYDGFPDYVKTLTNKQVYNVGVLGGNKKVAEVCYKVWENCDSKVPPINLRVPNFVIDQAYFNILCHTTEYRAFGQVEGQGSTYCPTIGTVAEALPNIFLIDGVLCNDKQQPYCMVHQYERWDWLRYKGKGRFVVVQKGQEWPTCQLRGSDYHEMN